MFELLNRLLRCVHRNTGCRRQAVRIVPKNIRMINVKCPADGAAQFVVLDMRREQSLTGIKNGKIKPHFIQPLVQELRQRSSSTIISIFRGIWPPDGAGYTMIAAFCWCEVVPTKTKGCVPRPLVALNHR